MSRKEPQPMTPSDVTEATGAGVPGRDDAAHEGQCRRCGVSCHLAIPVNGTPVTIPGLRCQFLEREGALWGCQVYANRFEQAPWCHHADVAAPQGFLANDCPYALQGGHTHGKITLTGASYDRIWSALLGEIKRCGVPTWIHQDALIEELQRRESGVWRLKAEGALLRPYREGES